MKTAFRVGLLLILLGVLQFVVQALSSQSGSLFKDIKRVI